MDILIIGNSFQALDSNQVGFGNAFLERGDSVHFGHIDSVSSVNYETFIQCKPVTSSLASNSPVGGDDERLAVAGFDLVWVLNNPAPAIAKDVWLHLLMAEQKTQFVNSIVALSMLNAKSSLGLFVPPSGLVQNFVDYDFDRLWSILKQDEQQQWILKPTVGGCGSDVFLIDQTRVNARALVQSATGNQLAASDLAILGNHQRYVVMQAFIERASLLDKRVVVAGGNIITQFGRRAAKDDHRCNKTAGGELIEVDLDEKEYAICKSVAMNLMDFGINFAGIDLCYPFVIEINMVTPGGVDYARANGSNVTFKDTLDNVLSGIHRSGRRNLRQLRV